MVNPILSPPQAQWSWSNFLLCLGLSCGAMAYGYPSSIIGTILGQPSFLKYMGLVDEQGNETSNSASLIGGTNGAFQAGAFFGVLGGGLVMDRWGRKAGIAYSSILSIIGAALCCASQNIAMFIVCRFIAGLGAWSFLSASMYSFTVQFLHHSLTDGPTDQLRSMSRSSHHRSLEDSLQA
jgi:MFS family permease